MLFDIAGPFKLPRIKGDVKFIDRSAEAKQEFWDRVDASYPGLRNACGVYVMTIGSRPWYVGKAERQSFGKECLASLPTRPTRMP